MAGGRRSRERSRPHERASGAVLPFPGGKRLELARLAPTGRSIIVGLTLLLLAGGSYALARGTSAFAVREVTVEGPPRHVAKQVAEVLSQARGRSLLALDLPRLRVSVQDVPAVAAVRFDRAFPHTLRVIVVPERPVAVLRQGRSSWLVAASGRVITPLERGDRKRLPRIWLKHDVEVRVGQRVAGNLREAVRVVAPLVRAPLPARVASLRYGETELTLVLRSGAEVRLGDQSDRALKLELARQILPRLSPDDQYLDLSVPERPVSSATLNSEVEVEVQPSSSP